MGNHHRDLAIIRRDGEGGETIRDQTQELRLLIWSRLDSFWTGLQWEPKEDDCGDEIVIARAPITYMNSSSGGLCMEEHQVNNQELFSIVEEVSGSFYVLQLYFQS